MRHLWLAAVLVVAAATEAAAVPQTAGNPASNRLSDGTSFYNALAAGGAVDTELAAAAALSDTFANPTTATAGAMMMGWTGAVWHRLASTIANGLVVDVSRVQGTVATNQTQLGGAAVLVGNGITGTGSPRVTIASDNTAFSVNNTQVGTASQNVAQFGGSAVVTGTGIAGVGVPRVTMSNDSSLAANQSVNVAQVNGVATT
ncbi:MAG: hypothetical protein Q8S13_04950, partial [Dehalococcoidia bacterium]|nr:hypothetical protein [Dehalococcoidia bacterium]